MQTHDPSFVWPHLSFLGSLAARFSDFHWLALWLLIRAVRHHFRDGRIHRLFDYNANPEALLWRAFGLGHPGPFVGSWGGSLGLVGSAWSRHHLAAATTSRTSVFFPLTQGLCHPGPLFGYEAFGGLCGVFCAGNSAVGSAQALRLPPDHASSSVLTLGLFNPFFFPDYHMDTLSVRPVTF